MLCVVALLSCAPEGTDVSSVAHQEVATAPKGLDHCRDGDSKGRRLNDLAEHVYDAALADYLLENASGIGRKATPRSEAHPMMPLADDVSCELCITMPERCLRVSCLRTNSRAERNAIWVGGAAAYHYERARTCLQRAGDAYAERQSPAGHKLSAARLDAACREMYHEGGSTA